MWRSAGWPCHDAIELDLLTGGLLERRWDAEGRETLRVTDAGLAALAARRAGTQRSRTPHEALVLAVVREMQRAGRLAWRGLTLRAPLVGEGGATAWVTTMPDVFSIRQTTVEEYLDPVVHEIKVSRADLLSDLRRAAKHRAYEAVASQCWYVLGAGIAQAHEVPDSCGVMWWHEDQGLEVARPAPRRALRLGLPTWMALARKPAEPPPDDADQGWLGAAG